MSDELAADELVRPSPSQVPSIEAGMNMAQTDEVVELEKQFALPAVNKDAEDKEETETEEEWKSCCQVRVSPRKAKKVEHCDEPAVTNMTLRCPFDHVGKWALCERHSTEALQIQLCCTTCSRKANTDIYFKPIIIRWAEEEEEAKGQ